MSSPITLSGFNNIDFSTIVNALMAAAAQPLTDLQTRQSALQTQASNLTTLAARASSLKTAVAALADPKALTAKVAASSDTSVLTASATTTAANGHYDLQVTSLAKSQVTASSTTAPDTDSTMVAVSGTLTIGAKDVAIPDGGVTLQGLADAINGTEDIGVAASIVQTSATAYRLVLTANATGTASAFTVTKSGDFVDGDTASVAFTDPNATDAADTKITVNGVESVRSGFTFAGAIPGVTLTVNKKTTNPIGVDVGPDAAGIKSKLIGFITQYNLLETFAQNQLSDRSDGSIGHDPGLRALRQTIRGTASAKYAGGTYEYLSQVGVEFTASGTMQVNSPVFDAAMKHAPDQVAALLAASANTGAFAALSTRLAAFTDKGGLLDTEQARQTSSLARLAGQIDDMATRLLQQRAQLQSEFTAADTAMADLKNQSGSLANFSTNLTSAI